MAARTPGLSAMWAAGRWVLQTASAVGPTVRSTPQVPLCRLAVCLHWAQRIDVRGRMLASGLRSGQRTICSSAACSELWTSLF